MPARALRDGVFVSSLPREVAITPRESIPKMRDNLEALSIIMFDKKVRGSEG